MSMKKWIQVNEIGELYKECVLVHFDVPLLFVCKDTDDKRYLVLCIDEEEGRYLCLQVTNELLLKMLNKEITMADTFRHTSFSQNFLISYDFMKESFEGHYISTKDLTEDMLPDEGAYFELSSQKISQYILKLQNENLVNVIKGFPICVVRTQVSRKVIVRQQVRRDIGITLLSAYNRRAYKKMMMGRYDATLLKMSRKQKKERMSIANRDKFLDSIMEQMNQDKIKIECRGVEKCLVK